MKCLTNLLSGALVAILAVGATAQTRPDFSGRWTSEPSPAGDGQRGAGGERIGDMGSGWGSSITITQTSERVTVEYVFFARGDMQPPLRFFFALDGSETKNSVMMGRGIQMQTSKTAWDGDKLVITTTHSFAGPETGQPLTSEVKQTLALESPTSLIIETTRSGVLGGPSSTTRTVYRKL
jgi:arylsulfatase